jgi:non-ribosomal peptide synthetase component F
VPLDPNFPADRLSIYLEDSQSVAVITEHKNLELATSLIADLPCQPKVRTHCV